MKTLDDARVLANTMIGIGGEMGKKVVALLTDMDQPLGRAVGNALEVVEAVEMLRRKAPADYTEITLALTSEMLVLGGKAKDEADARQQMEAAINTGAALKVFREMCIAQGGDPKVVDDYKILPTAKKLLAVKAPADAKGFVSEVDALKCGHAIMALGGGRAAVTDKVDHAVGIADLIKIGEPVVVDMLFCMLHVNDDVCGAKAEVFICEAIRFTPTAPQQEPLIQDLIQ